MASHAARLLLAGATWLMATGCSNAPMLDVLDWAAPGRMPKGKVNEHGGVCAPGQGTIPIVAPQNPNFPTTPPVAVPVVPAPAPLPGTFTPTPPPPVSPPPPPPPPMR